MSYTDFFKRATRTEGQPDGLKPFPYQCRLAEEPWPELLDVPTGMGKTAAVALAWLWKRGWREGGREAGPDAETPRRLVVCLPMRVLVEQTERNARRWLENLAVAGVPGENKVSVHLLMGGSEDVKKPIWADYPEEDAILIGTQDMLLSRALMRGYGMSRYQWPVHFAWLHNDALWVFDEVQLMGAGLSTSVQLELFQDLFWKPAMSCHFLWMSATPGEGMFDTRDRRDKSKHELQEAKTSRLAPGALERNEPAFKAGKEIEVLSKQPKIESSKSKDGILDLHKAGQISLLVVNTVRRAQELYQELETAFEKRKNKKPRVPELLLLHGRMRPCDRKDRMNTLLEFSVKQKANQGSVPDHPGVIVVATQVVEAGVDISASCLWTEIAPWASIIQRLGRLNRDGRLSGAKAFFWMPKADKDFENSTKEDAPNAGRIGPYDKSALDAAKNLLNVLNGKLQSGLPYRAALDEVNDSDEGKKARAISHTSVIRPTDFYELFSTEPDLAGGFTDISRFVRDADNDPDVEVFWGEFDDQPSNDLDSTPDILCRVSTYVLKRFVKDKNAKAWMWDHELGSYESIPATAVCPGMTVLLSRNAGGYSDVFGWTGDPKDKPESGLALVGHPPKRDEDRRSETDWLLLPDHLRDAKAEASDLCQRFELMDEHKQAVVYAASWHDVGKIHEQWCAPLRTKQPGPGPWAKFKDVPGFRPRLRHEAASALAAWSLWQQGDRRFTALAIYLVAAHHGKVRTVLRSTRNGEDVFGIKSGDTLAPLPGWYEHSISLDVMPRLFATPGYWLDDSTFQVTMPSWTSVVSELLGGSPEGSSTNDAIPVGEPRDLGPFALAFLEMLVIVADHRASAAPGRGRTP